MSTRWQNTHPRHELNKNGEFSMLQVPQTAVVLNDSLMTQILQQLNLALQSIHFLQKKGHLISLHLLIFTRKENTHTHKRI